MKKKNDRAAVVRARFGNPFRKRARNQFVIIADRRSIDRRMTGVFKVL